MTTDMAKVWNINSSILAILAVIILIGQVIAGSEVGAMAFTIIVYIIIKTKRGENAHN